MQVGVPQLRAPAGARSEDPHAHASACACVVGSAEGDPWSALGPARVVLLWLGLQSVASLTLPLGALRPILLNVGMILDCGFVSWSHRTAEDPKKQQG